MPLSSRRIAKPGVTHYSRLDWDGAPLCDGSRTTGRRTENRAHVTCKRCLRLIGQRMKSLAWYWD